MLSAFRFGVIVPLVCYECPIITLIGLKYAIKGLSPKQVIFKLFESHGNRIESDCIFSGVDASIRLVEQCLDMSLCGFD